MSGHPLVDAVAALLHERPDVTSELNLQGRVVHVGDDIRA